MDERHLVAIDPIARHEQPAPQSLLDVAARVSQGRIATLHGEDVGVAQEALQYGYALVHHQPQVLRRDALPFTLDLDGGFARRAIGAVHDGQAGHAFAADNRRPLHVRQECLSDTLLCLRLLPLPQHSFSHLNERHGRITADTLYARRLGIVPDP